MDIPNPILFSATPEQGLTMEVTAEPGGLLGLQLLGQGGPPFLAEVSTNGGAFWQTVAYPLRLESGWLLRLTREDSTPTLSTLRAVVSIADSPSGVEYVVTVDGDGYVTLTDADATVDAQGYQTIPDATATTDPDGYQSVQRSS